MFIQGILDLCEFHYCEFHYCDFSKHSRNFRLMRFLAKIFHYCDFYYTAKYTKNSSNEIFWPKKRISQICGFCEIWLMRLFPRTKIRIRQGPSVAVYKFLRLVKNEFRFKL